MRPPPSFTKEFAESLPSTYRSSFVWATITEHSAVAYRRKQGAVGLGTCTAPRLPGAAICVVAEDRAGLLATISAALVRERLDVIGAEAYTRLCADQRREAVDIFWVQRLDVADSSTPLSAEDLHHLETTLNVLLEEQLTPHNVSLPPAPPPPSSGHTETNVRFLEDKAGQLSTLEVETDDRTGLLLVLARALFEQKVQIVSSQVRTEAGRVRDRFTITELDDKPIVSERRFEIQVAVLTAIQEVMQHYRAS